MSGPETDMHLTSVALCLTHDCNLRCKYCYAGRKVARSMSSETAQRSLEFIAAQSNSSCTVTFFGGEPLTKFALLKETVRFGEELFPGRFDFRMATNGTLIDSEVIQFLRDHQVYFSLSLDGTPEQHDCNRSYGNAGGSYAQVARDLESILDFNPYTVAVSVITPQSAEYLADGVRHLFGLGFRYVVQTLDYSADWQSEHIKILKRQYEELAKFYYDSLRAGKKIYYSPFDARIQTWAQKPYSKGELCDLARSQVAIAASGRIYPCVQFVGQDDQAEWPNSIGDVRHGFDQTKRNWFIQQNQLDTDTCVGCALHGRCATYCGCVNWHATGKINQIPPIICEHERMLMPIVDRLANRLWKQNVDLFKRKFYDKTFPISSFIEDCMASRNGENA
ncbi:MAG: radical SAM protein [bacterium]|nr:radical SAM protein [bacterium]